MCRQVPQSLRSVSGAATKNIFLLLKTERSDFQSLENIFCQIRIIIGGARSEAERAPTERAPRAERSGARGARGVFSGARSARSATRQVSAEQLRSAELRSARKRAEQRRAEQARSATRQVCNILNNSVIQYVHCEIT